MDIQVRSGSPTSDSAAIPEGSRVPLTHVPPQRKIFKPVQKVKRGVTTTTRRRRRKRIDTSQPGNIAGKLRMMKDSRNLRFRQLHHPPDPTVVIIFVLFISTLAIFHLYIRPKYFSASSVPDPHVGNNAHVEL